MNVLAIASTASTLSPVDAGQYLARDRVMRRSDVGRSWQPQTPECWVRSMRGRGSSLRSARHHGPDIRVPPRCRRRRVRILDSST